MSGQAWVYGDDINTDVLYPGAYLKGPVEEAAKHCLEAIDPTFVPNVKKGDIVGYRCRNDEIERLQKQIDSLEKR